MKKLTTILSLTIMIAVSCKKDMPPAGLTNKITIQIDSIFNIYTCYNNPTVQSSIDQLGGKNITQHGHCWDTTSNPQVSDNKTQLGALSDTDPFISQLTGLLPNTQYYVKGYIQFDDVVLYSKQDSFITKSPPCGGITSINYGGQTYNTVEIGCQCWMVENLKTTKYNDDSIIPLVTDQSTWDNLTTPGYCWYNNDSLTYSGDYGALYNWFTIETSKLCPTGWHVPTYTEWTILRDFLGGQNVVGGKMKETGTTHWNSPNTGATNSSGFTALPGGRRISLFELIGNFGYWWSATPSYFAAMNCYLSYNDAQGNFGDYGSKKFGYSVRCVKD